MRLGLVNPFFRKDYMTKPPEIQPHQAHGRVVRRALLASIVLEMFCFKEVISPFPMFKDTYCDVNMKALSREKSLRDSMSPHTVSKKSGGL